MDMDELLAELHEYLDPRADVNHDGTGPNQAMRLLTAVELMQEQRRRGVLS